jgi:hypothetical protein
MDFYDHNQDGLGVMYAEDGELIIEKFVPKTEKSVLKFYETHVKGRDAIVHWRMKTHGKIDMANAHPYEVLNKKEHGIDLWMVHNGILSGVASDVKEMSDTWHFIRDTVRPILSAHPDLLRDKAFIELLEDRIGSSNKLVFLDNFGRQTVVNIAAFHDFSGAKLSNTYAWSSHSKHNLKAPEPKSVYYGYHQYNKNVAYKPYQGSATQVVYEKDEVEEEYDEFEEYNATQFKSYSELESLVYEYPDAVADMLNDWAITASDVKCYIGEAV